MKIQYINQSEFNKIESIRQIIVHDNAQKFAIIDLGKSLGIYGLSWRSDLIEPIIKLSNKKDTLWIGIDQKLTAINLKTGHICLSLSFITFLYQILIKDNLVAILTEQEVLLINEEKSLKCFKNLPDLASEISILGEDFLIKMFDDSSFILTSTGILKEANFVCRI